MVPAILCSRHPDDCEVADEPISSSSTSDSSDEGGNGRAGEGTDESARMIECGDGDGDGGDGGDGGQRLPELRLGEMICTLECWLFYLSCTCALGGGYFYATNLHL